MESLHQNRTSALLYGNHYLNIRMGISSISFPIILLKLVPPLFTGVMSCCNLQHAVDIVIMIVILSIALLRYFREKQCPSGPVRLAGPSTWLSELTSGMLQAVSFFHCPCNISVSVLTSGQWSPPRSATKSL